MSIIPRQDNLSVLVFLFFIVWLLQKILKTGRREPYLPPGPPTVPILGNLHVFPTKNSHIRFTEWAQQYGDIYSLKISSGTVIVISGMEAASELMDKRSATTADRPKSHMAKKVTNDLNMAACRYSDTWRVLRKAAHTVHTPAAAENHLPIQNSEQKLPKYCMISFRIPTTSSTTLGATAIRSSCPSYLGSAVRTTKHQNP
uniref:Cytochrome p450 n=1 Tax=Moniliophthora roreri TaxID=221103 RepID=A0A0W0FWJ0_MONRR